MSTDKSQKVSSAIAPGATAPDFKAAQHACPVGFFERVARVSGHSSLLPG